MNWIDLEGRLVMVRWIIESGVLVRVWDIDTARLNAERSPLGDEMCGSSA